MNYQFRWVSRDIDGAITGKYEQVIYGESLCDAVEYWGLHYGVLTSDYGGNTLEITSIKEHKE